MKRSWILAVLISLAIVGSAFAVVGGSQALTTQTGKVSVTISYNIGGVTGPANGSTVTTVYTYNGAQVATATGAKATFNLNYGNYYIKVSPLYGVAAGIGKVIANGTTIPLSVSSSSQNVPVVLSGYNTHPVTVNLLGMSGGSATVTFATASGFDFTTSTTTNGTINNVYLPNTLFYSKVSYAGASYSYTQSLLSTTNVININLVSSSGISGFVYSNTGATINSVNVIILNNQTTPHTYTVNKFASSYFQVFSNSTDKELIVTSPGYEPYYIKAPTSSSIYQLTLNQSSNNVYYNYSIAYNLTYVTENITYNLGDSATISTFFNNSTVGSLMLQQILDNLQSTDYQNFLDNLVQQYTNNSLTVGGYTYQLLGISKVKVENINGVFYGYINASYKNSGVPLSLYNSDFNINVYTQGTQYLPGTLNYKYSIAYDNSSIALKTSTVTTQSERSPILISSQASNQWVTLTMSKSEPPAFVPSQISLYWNNIVSSNYVLNSSQSGTVFVVPSGTSVSLNLSNAYFNPVTGQKDYLNPNNNFTWKIGSTVIGYGYNITHAFTSMQTVTINAISSSGISNSTSFTVYANSANPSPKYNLLVGGQSVVSGSATSASAYVPQSALVTFSAYGSSSPIGGYQVPLTYTWTFPGFASAALNATYSFSTPSISAGVQTGTLTVTSVTGQKATVTFQITVNDTTPANAVIKLSALNGTSVTSPTVGNATVFSANSTTDPYYTLGPQSFNWTVLYQNGTTAKQGSSTYDVVGGAVNNSSYVILKFNTIDSMIVSLKVTNAAGVVSYNNKTVSMIVDSPRLVVNSVYFGKNLTQGSKAVVYVNISNVGTQNAPSFQISLYINNKVVATNTYSNLSAGQSKNVSFSWTPSTSGTVTLEFRGNTSLEPASFPAIGAYTTTISIKPPAYKTPLIIGGVIAVIVIVGFVYYRLSSGRGKRPSQKQPKPPKAKTTEPKKPAEKKK